jgi:hypothetical protein
MYRTSNPGQNTSIYIARHDYIPCAPTIYIASSKVSNKTMATRLCAGIYHSCPLLTLSFCAVDSSSFTLHNHTGDQVGRHESLKTPDALHGRAITTYDFAI